MPSLNLNQIITVLYRCYSLFLCNDRAQIEKKCLNDQSRTSRLELISSRFWLVGWHLPCQMTRPFDGRWAAGWHKKRLMRLHEPRPSSAGPRRHASPRWSDRITFQINKSDGKRAGICIQRTVPMRPKTRTVNVITEQVCRVVIGSFSLNDVISKQWLRLSRGQVSVDCSTLKRYGTELRLSSVDWLF